jgi:hypothetical protein
MSQAEPETPERSKATTRRVERLLSLIDRIQGQPEPPPELFQRFQSRYAELPRDEQPLLFDTILSRLEVARADLDQHLQSLLDAEHEDPIRWSRRLTDLRRTMESPRMRAFRRFLNHSGGFRFLLDLRADVLAAQRQTSLDLEPLEEEMAHLFNSWFRHGLLFLQEITRDSSYRQIRFLKEHDMVHPMTSIEEMASRLGEDRRCFALYHRAMPEEPVVFIEVALTRGISRSIHDIIRYDERPTVPQGTPDTAIFYSINNTQNGLAGLGLGKVLVFQVVEAIQKDQPGVKTFSTLSPIPGFWPRYLRPIVRGYDAPFLLKRELLEEVFPEKTRQALLRRHAELTGREAPDLAAALLEILSQPAWIEDPIWVKLLERPLVQLAYSYITEEKNQQGQPLNPVANFHMSNGARVSVKNVNFGANRSERGLEESCGMMVNYVYSGTWLQQIGRTMQALLLRRG